MHTLRQLLGSKIPEIYAVAPGDSVIDAIRLMAEKSVGAVLVMDGASLAGIVSERDYARKVVLHGRSSADTSVRDIMTPGVITVGLFSFLAAWNDFIAPLMILNDTSKYPLPLAVANLRQETMGAVDYGITQAGVTVLAVPCIILFLLLQRFYVKGFMSGALKG